ncbi:MAG: RuBisCO large subunit C-terminal-like domain-containing protein [Balneolaceae bacterium]
MSAPAPSTFTVTYGITASSPKEAEAMAAALAVEQSVEMPPETVPDHLKGQIGAVESLESDGSRRWQVAIRYPRALAGDDPIQLVNVLFGNSSLQPGIRLLGCDPSVLSDLLPGPSFGIDGIRSLLNVPKRALSCTALKPVGCTPAELAERAYACSTAGIDVIKDDHNLANQPSAPFEHRLLSVLRAVRKGEQRSGKRTLYFPNITGRPEEIRRRFELAQKHGADGVLICPDLAGWGALIDLAASANPLPVMAHPALSGSRVLGHESGMSPSFLYGTLWRAFGADAVVYPNAGGRFQLSKEQCLAINEACRTDSLPLAAALPVPGGGIDRTTVASWVEIYGPDTLFLIGGSLYNHPLGLETAVREFQSILNQPGS